MKARELRLGNYFMAFDDAVEQVYDNIFELDEGVRFINDSNITAVKPIELTDEWMIQFGFHKYQSELSGVAVWDDYELNGLVITTDRADGVFANPQYLVRDMDNVKLKYVHQLQNLYFCLAGEELKRNVIDG